MFSSVFSFSRLASTVALLGIFVCSPLSALATSEVSVNVDNQPNQVVTFTKEESQLACAGCGGAAGASSAITSGACQLVISDSSKVASDPVSDSLWGNLLLSMAYQRDAETKRLVKKLNRVNTWTILSIAGISGLSLAQSISSYSSLQGASHLEVEEHDGHSHVNTEADSKTPSVLGIIGSGATIATLGYRAIASSKLQKKITARQRAIQEKIALILTSLEAGQSTDSIKLQLNDLVGERASGEFISLWNVTHLAK